MFVFENSAHVKCWRTEQGHEERARMTTSLGSRDWPLWLIGTTHRTGTALGHLQGQEAA